MLQRIQSIFLLSALALLGLLFVLPFARMIGQSNEYATSAVQFPTVMIQVVAFAVTLITIFLYRKRMLQIRLCVFNCALLLGYQGFIIWHVYQLSKLFDAVQLKAAMVIPAIAAILTFLALRGIAKDEALVRSLERLR
jgi:hypothetical protein